MITAIQELFHSLQKGESIKVVCLEDYEPYIDRTDLIKPLNENVLMIYRANGMKVAINTDKVVMCCIVEGVY